MQVADPPLSPLGHEQARATAAALADQGIDLILSSPYCRVIQTCQPLAQATGLPVCIEDGLAEFAHHPGTIQPSAARVAYFPEVDEDYVPMHRTTTPAGGAETDCEYMRRMLLMARLVPHHHAGKTVAMFSHAASVALVAALTGVTDITA